MIINGTEISENSRAYVVAEIGANHCGSIEICELMFLAAKLYGADAVKLQKRKNTSLYTKKMLKSEYANVNAYAKTYGEHREILEFNDKQFCKLHDWSRKIGITFFATAFDEESADFLKSIDMPAYKISSFDLTNAPLLEKIASYGKPVILSTGGSSLSEIRDAVNLILQSNKELAILQCTSSYPTMREDVNLSVIDLYKKEFPEIIIGYSGHDIELDITKFAIAKGAKIIEKHFTLDKTWKGTDQSMSLLPSELKEVCEASRCFYEVFGKIEKKPLESEKTAFEKMVKCVVAAKQLLAGSVLTQNDFKIKSCGDFGITPDKMHKLINKRITVDIIEDEAIKWEDLE
ncbi:MAG: N-acetylneuraminate synthase family protein [Holosporaceae bacterium]|jgi:N-acetylneuraminate synthase/sialic acid synthase|nr:N-acetylneuraminate synthase family protein [Holosporaceae bacterium]